jgi:hypothetical protein
MVMARGPGLPGELYAHCLGAGALPRLTVTTHRDHADRTVWYLGGRLAEEGVARDCHGQVAVARDELARLFPRLDLSRVEFSAFRVDRAEIRQPDGKRPDAPGVVQHGRVISAWPIKLAMAPIMADKVIARLEADGVRPASNGFHEALADWPRPAVATFPWDEDGRTWY